MLNESVSIKRSEDARKNRDNKKFGKRVQAEKLVERSRAKSDTLSKIQAMKKSLPIHILTRQLARILERKGNTDDGKSLEDFDVTLEDEKPGKSNKRAKKVFCS